MSENAAALIVAAGKGQRFGGSLPKVYVDLCGEPLFVWAIRAYADVPEISRIVVVVAAEFHDIAEHICMKLALGTRVDVVDGGARRQDSVMNGLHAMAADAPSIVCIHDGARPLVTPAIIRASIDACRMHGAVVVSMPVTDTIKAFDGEQVLETLDRSKLRAIQTPQTFRYDLIVAAHEYADQRGLDVTDDGSVVETYGHPVVSSEGSAENLKVTEAGDLPHAAWIISRRQGRTVGCTVNIRVGHGYDLHRLVESRRLVLCGVEIEHPLGLLGHSDADVALHAVADAILGAAGLGDIGQHFPDTSEEFKGADSRRLLAEVVQMASEAGWNAGNVDVTIIAQQPKLAPHRQAMIASLANTLGVDEANVSVKATTNEGLGPEGEGKAISSHAVVLLYHNAQ